MSHSVELISNLLEPKNRPSSSANTPHSDWKKELANATTSVSTLLHKLNLSHHINSTDLKPDFTCLVTDSYINKIKIGDFGDPLLQQILPLQKENDNAIQTNGSTNPVGDIEAVATQGLLHKYHGRALLISTGACAVHCRYCFRRHYPYQQLAYSNKALTDVLFYLDKHSEIEEVILSGGDPLILDNEKLARLITQLESLDHIQTLRIHTRLPVVLPSRIDEGLLALLRSSRFDIVMVIHANHANEIQKTEQDKLQQLNHAGVTLLNQSVLLKGINDNADTLITLSKQLFQCKTLPYYLHLFDPVKGAMHFDTTAEMAIRLKQKMEQQLPGYLVPRLVQEIAGNQSKTAIFSI
ncbi:Lysine 2,3-aminomutase [hydrothermal vent metagenome]|uniref:L-lysine 2,3-aminomutase n=1 Tax=hydrothermal vent metagenome TaxID=652676 RepID=A0A3B0WRR7_9ZZZZ